NRTGDHDLLNFRRALADGAQLSVAIILFCREILGITITPKNLNTFGGNPYSRLGSKELCHGRLLRNGQTAVFKFSGPEGKKPGSLDLGGHIRQLEGDALKRGDGAVKLVPFLGVFEGGFESANCHAKAEGCNGNSAAIQDLQRL